MSRYIIGIDLGTTNIALAYIDLKKAKSPSPAINTFTIPQLVGQSEMGDRPLLPSFLYLPGEHDLPVGALALDWDRSAAFAAGEFARNHGSKIPGRLVTSAKSWLCHGGVDRTSPLLPWSAPPEVERISPVEASARYLRHLIAAWNHAMAAGNDDARLERQKVVLTVPASFDDMARTLTVEAANQAGLENVTLLEEPQAAFYCWMASSGRNDSAQKRKKSEPDRDDSVNQAIKPGWHCLVVDVGGGTSDFSLIQAVEEQGELTFVRQAVGDHLLLGGDNMDLTLARHIEAKVPQAGKLDAVQYGMLTQACRQAKESLLGPNAPQSHDVTVVGRGRKVIGGTFHTELTPADVEQVILDGFFPFVNRDAQPERTSSAGLHEMGLPYVSDPAVTRHLAQFLQQHHAHDDNSTDSAEIPSRPQAILFNGGVFQPAKLRQRVVDILKTWYDSPENPWQPLVLHNDSLDLAVSFGAAYFGWLKHTGGKRIGGGIPRSYYIAVAGKSDASADRETVLCVVPQHLEEGEEIKLPEPELELALGQPVTFPLYTSTVREGDHAGDVVDVEPNQLWRLPPVHTILRGGKRSTAKTVGVTLASRSTEIGTVEVWCEAKEGTNRWRLEFNVRDIVGATMRSDESGVRRQVAGNESTSAKPGHSSLLTSHSSSSLVDVWPEEQVEKAGEMIKACFGDSSERVKPKDLMKKLEAALDAPRKRWPMGLCRRLWEFLHEASESRRQSPSHLNRWYNLAGYCLRPGFGDSLDKFRVEQVWKTLHAPKKQIGKKKAALSKPEAGEQFWIMMRRISGGLDTARQNALFNRIRPYLIPSKGKGPPKPPVNELAEMWRTACGLELLDVKLKEQLGNSLMKSLRRSPTPNHGFPCLTRLGARMLPYGPLNAVLHPRIAEQWLDAILRFKPGHQSEATTWAFCLVQLARKTGQRALDIDESHRRSVLGVLPTLDVSSRWRKTVEEVTELQSDEQTRLIGDDLPVGLRLAES